MWKGFTHARCFWSWRWVSWSSSEEFTYPIEWEAGWAQEVNRTCWRKPLALPGMRSWSSIPQPLAFLTRLSWLVCNIKAVKNLEISGTSLWDWVNGIPMMFVRWRFIERHRTRFSHSLSTFLNLLMYTFYASCLCCVYLIFYFGRVH